MEVILPVGEAQVQAGNSEVERSCPVEECPRCGSRLSLCADAIVRVERVRS